MVESNAPGSVISEYEVELKRDERIMRFLTTKMDKFSGAWAEKRRNRKAKA